MQVFPKMTALIDLNDRYQIYRIQFNFPPLWHCPQSSFQLIMNSWKRVFNHYLYIGFS